MNQIKKSEDEEIVEYSSSNEYEDYDENDSCEDGCDEDGCDEDGCDEDGCDEDGCEHTFILDLIDIDPDRAQQITYCTKCFFVLD
jgi:hypothetical protein